MTYRPPAIRVALDLTDALYDAALDLGQAAHDYGRRDTESDRNGCNAAGEAVDVARTKLIEHLLKMSRDAAQEATR